MKIKHKWINIFMCIILITTTINLLSGDEIVLASDTNIVEYNDIFVPAFDGTGTIDKTTYNYNMDYQNLEMSNFSLKVHRDALTIKNIRYNRNTKELTYDISSNFTYNIVINRDVSRFLDKYGLMNLYWGYQVSYTMDNKLWGYSEAGGTSETSIRQYGQYSQNITHYGGIDPQTGGNVLKPELFNANYSGDNVLIPNSLSGKDLGKGTEIYGNPTKIEFITRYQDFVGLQAGLRVDNEATDHLVLPLIQNSAPSVTVISQSGVTITNDSGSNIYNVEGYASDPNNDALDVVVEIPNVYYRKIKIYNTQSSSYFNLPIDTIEDSIPPGNYQVKITVVDPYNLKADVSVSLTVINRLRNKSFILINSPIDISTKYSDYENDAAYSWRYRYDHDPDFFDNSMGILSDSSLWRTAKYASFPFSGVYVATVQAKDNPKPDDRFNNYRVWSRDNLSSMTFHVHRKPVALFAAKIVGGSLQITDISYDLDHTTAINKGLGSWQWQYRKSGSEVWTEGQPPANLPTRDQYEIRLRVRDVDGENGVGVWSNWCQRTVGIDANLPPVALFTVDPSIVSHRKATTITDKSFDPDNDILDVYSWSVVKDGWNTVWSHWGGATTPPNIASFGIGNYQINLQVHDNRGLWSEWYSQFVIVMNHPPVAAFYMLPEVYRDTVVTMENLTPDPDADGDALVYNWNSSLNGGVNYYAGSNRNQNIKIQDLISRSGISQKAAISDGWEMHLTASDGSLSSNAIQNFKVKNHIPTAAINGPTSAHQYDTIQYLSEDEDGDPSDAASLQYYWRVTDSDSTTTLYRTKNIKIEFPEKGVYTIEHWAVDQIGDKSNIAVLKVNVAENLTPLLTLTSPAGTSTNPTIIDAAIEGDPLIKWNYSDPENDPQEKYRLEFFSKNSLLVHSVENSDSSGLLRQYQIPNQTFERFEYFTVYGRAYSKLSWSEISSEKTFIIDNPPVPGFTLITETGKDASKVPIYRTDLLNITGIASDLDEPKGDSISYKYYLKPAGGTEGLASISKDFTKKFTSNGVFTFRQLVTDSLGLYRELTQSITVVNRIPSVNITYPTSNEQSKPTIASTLTPIIKWDYQDDDGDLQQRFKVRIINLATGAIKVQSGEQVSSAKQWLIPAGALIENEKYAVEIEAYDGFNWSTISPRKYFMVNLLSIKGGVKHTEEWNNNRKGYNLKKSGDEESPRGYNVFWAGERFVLQGTATGLPDTVQVTMKGGYTTLLTPTNSEKTLWAGELYDSAFEKLADGPITFTFTAVNEYNTKVDTVTVVIAGDWSEYFQNHRVK